MTRGHLEVSGHSLGYYHRKGRVFLASCGWRPRTTVLFSALAWPQPGRESSSPLEHSLKLLRMKKLLQGWGEAGAGREQPWSERHMQPDASASELQEWKLSRPFSSCVIVGITRALSSAAIREYKACGVLATVQVKSLDVDSLWELICI